MQLDVKRMADVVLEAIAIPLAAFAARLKAVEERQPQKGDPGEPGSPGVPGVAGEPGNGIADVMIDRDGSLMLVMTDGSTRDAGRVIGRDGRSVDMDDIDVRIAERVNAIPAPKDGKDGVDGLGFDDLSVDYDGERTFSFRFARGEQLKEYPFKMPVMIYRGAFREQAYERGDTVTFGGSLWHCNSETGDKPDDGVESWTRAVRRGRDGKNGKDGEKGEPGRAGRDLTDGSSKW